jgi:ABC-type uncharacterized transport system involved in gliding motility auxiliary subunit
MTPLGYTLSFHLASRYMKKNTTEPKKPIKPVQPAEKAKLVEAKKPEKSTPVAVIVKAEQTVQSPKKSQKPKSEELKKSTEQAKPAKPAPSVKPTKKITSLIPANFNLKFDFKHLKNIRKINVVKMLGLQKIERQVIYVVAIGLFIVANLVLSFISLRLDFSKGQAYTLSSATKKILKKTDDIINIKFYVSSDLPTRLIPLKSNVTDLLGEYQKQSNGKVRVKIVDPKKDQTAANEAKEAGVPELQFSQVENDKYAVSAAYFGLVLSYADKKEVIPQVTDTGSLEYNLTSSIYKMTRKEVAKIGVLGEAEVNPMLAGQQGTDPTAGVKNVLRQQFIVDQLNVSSSSGTSKDIDPSYKALMVFDNRTKEYDPQEIQALKMYLAKKGNAIFFTDGVWVADSLTTSPAKNNLASVIGDYGIQVNSDLILSTSAELVNFGNEVVNFLTQYPFWIKTNVFDQKSSYFSNATQMTFPWVSSLTIQQKADVDVKTLVQSTNRSWSQKDTFTLTPQSIPQPTVQDLKQFIIAAEAKKKNEGHIIVVGSSRFALDQFASRSTDNVEFVLNALNDMASEGALTGIRQRAMDVYPIPDLPTSEKDFFKYLNMLLLPAAYAIFGGIRLMRRK